MRLRQRDLALIGVVVVLGVVALLEVPIRALRPAADAYSAVELEVVSARDRGPGTLREAILEADRIPRRARIVIAVPRVAVRTPLPPIGNPHGVVIHPREGVAEIDGRESPGGPLVTLRAPGSRLRDLRFAGSPGTALEVSAAGVELTNLTFVHCETGIRIGEGAADLAILESHFEANGIGLMVGGSAPGVRVANGSFRGHRVAAVWAVLPAPPRGAGRPLVLEENAFAGDRIGIAAGNMPIRVTANEFSGAKESALALFGSGVQVRANRIRGGELNGLVAVGTRGLEVTGNEVDHNRAVGIVVNAGRQSVVHGNHIYRNGYGLVSVFAEDSSDVMSENSVLDQRLDGVVVVGGSPMLRANRAVGNSAAGLRILDYLAADSRRRPAQPFLDGNTLRANGIDEPVRGVYEEPRPAGAE